MKTTSKTARKNAISLFSVAIFLAGGEAVRAQSALDGFKPNPDGAVLAVVVQPDGKILIGGNFSSLAPNNGPAVARNGIARLNADGTVDTAFNAEDKGSERRIRGQSGVALFSRTVGRDQFNWSIWFSWDSKLIGLR